jgi:hypothetical protein
MFIKEDEMIIWVRYNFYSLGMSSVVVGNKIRLVCGYTKFTK